MRFPQAEVTALIVGRRPAAHGSSDMPVWGPLFRELNPFDSRVDVRLLRLVDPAVDSDQVKPPPRIHRLERRARFQLNPFLRTGR